MDKENTYKYRVEMYGLEIIKFNKIIMKHFELVREQLGKYYDVVIASENKQGILRALSKSKIDEHHIPYTDFRYDILDKPLFDKSFDLEVDVKIELAKWTVNLMIEAGEYYECN